MTLAHARHRPAPGRREHEGRVRESPAPGDRGGAVVAQADHPVHRRGAHADRRRRRGRHRRRGEPAQAGAGARHAAHDRRDDLGRVQEAHREGPGADAALPGRAGEEPSEDEGAADDARRGLDAREAPPRAAARRGARGGGAALASLHPGAAVAGQVGEPARHRMRARRDQPARGAGRGRGQPAAHRRRSRPSSRSSTREAAIGFDDRARAPPKPRQARRGAQAPRASSRRAGRRRRRWSIAILALRAPSCAAVERARWKAPASTLEAARPPRLPRRRSRRPRRRAAPRARRASCAACRPSSAELQGESPLILPTVDTQAVARGRRGLDRHPGRHAWSKNEIETRPRSSPTSLSAARRSASATRSR